MQTQAAPKQPLAAQPGWQFKPDPDPESTPATSVDQGGSASWSASEYIAHSKPTGWYALLAIGTVLFSGGVYIVTRDLISVITIVVVAILFGVVAGRKPRVLQYSVTSAGIQAGSKNYPFSMFKSFSVIKEGAISSIYLTPLKRFMPAVTMYFPPENENDVLHALSLYLPEEHRQQDRVDRLMHHIRF